ncbi:unnamed protein product [Calypogeia fissa]
MKEQYEYLSLREALLRKGEEVNFYGAVSEYEYPMPTRGSDFICTMRVVDMSHDSPGLPLLIFASPANCPLVKTIGDIIRVHRVEMGDYRGEPQAIAKINRKSSYILFQGKNGEGYDPYQKAHNTFSFEQHDERRLDIMRNWIESHTLYTRVSDYLVRICGIIDGSYFDLCCKLLYVEERSPELSTIIYVWDGTDATPRTITTVGPDVEGEHFDLEATVVNGYPQSMLPRHVVCDFPPLGTVLPIIPDIQLGDLPGQLQCGDWLKFRNLACRSRSSVLEAAFTRESKISLLSKDNQFVKNCESDYVGRILSEQGRLPQSCPQPPQLLQSLTVTDYEHVRFSTLREVLAHPEVTSKFRCLVRVMSTCPSEVADFCDPSTRKGNNATTEDSNSQFAYAVRLTLEDPTARLHSYLHGEDGAKFFNGHPPADLHVDSSIVGAFERKVHKLLGVRLSEETGLPTVRDPPWIKCCIKSYYTDKSNPWKSRCFRIFGTRYI